MQDTSAWYAVWTRSRHEQVVREQLERKGLEAFLPTITKWSRWKDRKKQIDWPLFPGYCFVRFNGVDRLSVLKCTGVVSIVSFVSSIVSILPASYQPSTSITWILAPLSIMYWNASVR